jgi:L-iditol 2-dehydrogenase
LKALVYKRPYCLEYSDYPDPVPGDDDVLVRVKACGICGSDVHGFTGETGRRIPPLIMGHEAAGIVEKVGKNVKGFEREVLGVSVPEFKRHGAFAEYVAVPSWIVWKIPEQLSFTHAALLEPASIGVHAANRAPISAEDTAIVIGAGTIGLFILQAAKLRGAKRVIVCDINEFRLDVAKRLGADELINPAESGLEETVKKLTKNKGADVSFEAVGYAETFAHAVSATKTGGYVVAVGNLQQMADFNLQELVARELTFTGSYASAGEFRDCIGLVASGRINVEPVISDILPMKEGPSAFERLLKGEENLLKIVLEP